MSIHQVGFLSRKRVASLGAWLALSGMLLLPGHGIAQTVTLTDGGSAAAVDLGSSAGMNSWNVLNQNQLMQQWFWYRTDGGVAMPINSIGGLSYNQTAGLNTLDATYQNSQLSIEIVYRLTSTGPGSADMMENIYAVNLSGSQIQLNLFEYSNFNLLQSGNNSVSIFGSPGSGYNYVQQTSGLTAIQEAITSPNANYAEAGVLGVGDTLSNITTVGGYNLNGTTAAGPGDVSWAFQWAQAIDPGDELDVFKDKSLSIAMIPEPSTVAFIALGAGTLGLALRRKLS